MARRNRDAIGLVLIGLVALLLPILFVSLPSASAAVPSAPASCQAVAAEGGYEVTWERPAVSDSPVWAYVVKVKGQPEPVYRNEVPRGTENPLRSHLWTGPTVGNPPVFQVRAVNNSGFGAWCEDAVGGTTPPPTTTPTTAPTTTPTTTAPTTTAPTTTDPPPAGRPFIAYSPDAYLKDLAANEPVDLALTSTFRQFMATNSEQRNTAYPLLRGAGSNNWGMPGGLATCSDPVWKITSTAGDAYWRNLLSSQGFHAPANMPITGTSDSPISVVDSCFGYSVWAANVKKTGTLQLAAGPVGGFDHDSNGLDRRNPRSDSNLNHRSRGVIPDSMTIRDDMVNWALANDEGLGYVLEMFFVLTDQNFLPSNGVHPMVGEEGKSGGWGEEGMRIAIDADVNLDQRACSPVARVVAKTLQENGTYIGDNSGGASGLKVEEPGNFATIHEMQGCITWNDFVVLKPGTQVSP